MLPEGLMAAYDEPLDDAAACLRGRLGPADAELMDDLERGAAAAAEDDVAAMAS